RGGRRRLLDGGRRRAAAGDRGGVQEPRRAANGRRGPWRGSARRARGGRVGALRRGGRRGPADGHVLEVARELRRVHRRTGGHDRLPARLVAGVHVHRVGSPGGGGLGAGRDEDLPFGRGGGGVRQ